MKMIIGGSLQKGPRISDIGFRPQTAVVITDWSSDFGYLLVESETSKFFVTKRVLSIFHRIEKKLKWILFPTKITE